MSTLAPTDLPLALRAENRILAFFGTLAALLLELVFLLLLMSILGGRRMGCPFTRRIVDCAGWLERMTEEALEELTRFMVPLVSHDPGDPPNAAILLHEPVDLLGHRRWAWRDIRNKGTTGTSGLLLRVASPEDAAKVFGAWRVLRKFGAEDFPLIEPSKRDFIRAYLGRAIVYAF